MSIEENHGANDCVYLMLTCTSSASTRFHANMCWKYCTSVRVVDTGFLHVEHRPGHQIWLAWSDCGLCTWLHHDWRSCCRSLLYWTLARRGNANMHVEAWEKMNATLSFPCFRVAPYGCLYNHVSIISMCICISTCWNSHLGNAVDHICTYTIDTMQDMHVSLNEFEARLDQCRVLAGAWATTPCPWRLVLFHSPHWSRPLDQGV